MSTVAKDQSQGLHESRDRRFYARIAPQATTKIVFGAEAGNPGTLLNLSENGLLVSTVLPMAVDSVHRVVLVLHGIPQPLSLYLRTIWSDVSARKSGLQLLNLSEDDRMLLRAWALSQAKTVRTHTESVRGETADVPSQSSETASRSNLRAPSPLTRPLIPIIPAQLESPAVAPMRYFWVAALATIFLGATWAAVKTVGPVGSDKSIVKGARSNSPNRKNAGDATMSSDEKTTSASAVTAGQEDHVAVTHQSLATVPLAGPSTDAHSSSNGRVTELKHRSTTSQLISSPQSEDGLPGNDTLDSVPADSETQTAPAGNRGMQLKEKEAALSQLAARKSTDSAPVNSQPAGTVPPQVPTHATTTGSTGVASGSMDSLPRVPSRDSASSRIASDNPISAISSISKAPPVDPTALDPKPVGPKLENPRPPDSRSMDKRAATPNPNGSGGGSSETLTRPSMIDRSAPPPAFTTQTLEVPAFSGAAYVRLPGERVVRSPFVTMHVQRSVWVKASHWLWHSHKKVQLGELAARVDPQMPRTAKSYGSITVLATVEKDGQVSSVRPLYGSPQFLGSVMRAVREWRYQPTYVEKKPVETLARIEINFHAPESSYSR